MADKCIPIGVELVGHSESAAEVRHYHLTINGAHIIIASPTQLRELMAQGLTLLGLPFPGDNVT